MMDPDWLRLFPEADHRLQMNLRRGDAAQFWQRSPEAETVLAERRNWLAQTPQRYLQILPEGEEAVSEAIAYVRSLDNAPTCPPVQAAGEIEPDWIVLSGDAERSHPVIGGAVIFPSSWALEDKIGRPLHAIHAPVPGLQSSMGSQISTFLTRLVPHVAWERENWGLSADPALNHHPANPIKRLDARATLDQTWLRLEQQFLTRLPDTNAILFGIRVTNHRLDHLAAMPELAPRITRALETMSDDFCHYKGILEARPALLAELRSV
ncbi:heme-dependent oxidative N-demethylase subunit alpha family protein [Prosthecobacter sp.]|uniref:heme-dependent oxidative N-demethylase subunit alpha family protein n=1 Tax=Prosthecobacter sp. TaxID=1965333 RepID=UPI001D1FFD44|nr:heme-dependent oxidative N-demethylase subunit alpha family protein [Prosthecobacter sp.]MCB1275906.1 DUF3445 domain-containing protein [Prosthecobacter sp.]